MDCAAVRTRDASSAFAGIGLAEGMNLRGAFSGLFCATGRRCKQT
jgi:hypothetical protein